MASYTLYPSILPDESDGEASGSRDGGHAGESDSEASALRDAGGDPELCGATMTNGNECDRLADECPYESHRS